jgi:hypothetical protein
MPEVAYAGKQHLAGCCFPRTRLLSTPRKGLKHAHAITFSVKERDILADARDLHRLTQYVAAGPLYCSGFYRGDDGRSCPIQAVPLWLIILLTEIFGFSYHLSATTFKRPILAPAAFSGIRFYPAEKHKLSTLWAFRSPKKE